MGRQGIRAPWEHIPISVRRAIDAELGSRVVDAVNLDGGFSPGPAARCALADGTTAFVKACGPELNEFTPGIHRREIETLSALPAGLPRPRMIGSVDLDGWVAVIVEWVDGVSPTAVLDAGEVNRALRLVRRLQEQSQGLDVSHLPALADDNATLSTSWTKVADDLPAGLDGWSRDHLDVLIALESRVPAVTAGDSLLHFDIRTDNMLFAAAGPEFDVIVDWPSACRGAAWTDLVAMLPSFHLDGAPFPDEVLVAVDRSPIDDDDLDVFLAGLTGYFTHFSLLPPPPGLPTVRAFQAAQAEVCRTWLGRRLGRS